MDLETLERVAPEVCKRARVSLCMPPLELGRCMPTGQNNGQARTTAKLLLTILSLVSRNACNDLSCIGSNRDKFGSCLGRLCFG